MNQVVPWAALVALIAPFDRGLHQALGGRPPFPIETMLRIHCLQLWWNLSDPAMEEDCTSGPCAKAAPQGLKQACKRCQTDPKKRIAKVSGEPALDIRLRRFGEWGFVDLP